MLKRTLAAVCLTVATLLTLISCQIPGLGGNKDPEPKEYNRIICDTDLDLLDVRSAVSDITDSILAISDSSTSEGKGEIVFGDTPLAITAAAKESLEAELEKSNKVDCGYVIYVKGDNIAVYWDTEGMADIAVAKFLRYCVEEKKLVLDEGLVAYEYFASADFAKEKYWLALETEAPANVVAALRQAYDFFADPMLIGWMANLYDPEIGGFYYSNSARNNEPFRPDMESTTQIFSMLTSNGAISNRNKALPEDIKIKLVNFVRNMQSAKDGYFYHPQWAQDKSLLNVDRYGRDLAAAPGFITSFYIDTDGDGVMEQQRPLYCVPGSSTCALHLGTNERCVFPIASAQLTANMTASVTGNLTSDVRAAVSHLNFSNVAAVAASSHPDYSSPAAFEAWLRAYNGDLWERNDSGQAHNIAELRFEILQHGYMDILLDYLDEQQEMIYERQIASGETPTGMWQRTADYRAAWGFYKYMALYTLEQGRAIDIKYVPYIVDTYITVLRMPADGDYYINDIMNQWLGLSRLRSNVKKYYGDDEVQKIYDKVSEYSEELITNTLDKIAPFKRDDSSFSYNPSGRSLATIYGVPISLGEVEGDVNATLLALNTYQALFTGFGYDTVPLFTEQDGLDFVNIITNCSPIEKTERVFETVDFEDELDMEYVRTTGNTGDFRCEIVDDPKDPSNRVLYYESGSLGGPGHADTVSFVPVSAGAGCHILETKMYIDSRTDNGYLFQCSIQGSYNFTIHKSGSTVTIKDVSDTDRGADFDEIAKVTTDKWFTLRIEYYYPDSTGSNGIDKPVTKIFIDGELVTTSYKYQGSDISGNAPTAYGTARFYSLASPHTYVYFDDGYFVTETKIYNPDDDTITDSRG